MNCSSNLTNSVLKWFINDQEVNSENLIAYHINEYPVLLLTMRLEETWFERYNELRLECRAIVYETVANFQKKLNVQIIDYHRKTIPSLTVKGRGSPPNKQSNNARTYNTDLHVHNNGFNNDEYYRSRGSSSSNGDSLNGDSSFTELIPGITRGSASLKILNPSDDASNVDLDYHLNNNNNQLTYQRSPVPPSNNQQNNRKRPSSTVKRKRKRPNTNSFNQLDYDPDDHSSDDNDAIAANSLAANRNHCDSVRFVPTFLLLNLVLVFSLFRTALV